jgi:hypothetical protein
MKPKERAKEMLQGQRQNTVNKLFEVFQGGSFLGCLEDEGWIKIIYKEKTKTAEIQFPDGEVFK